jgi:hypothetical protein
MHHASRRVFLALGLVVVFMAVGCEPQLLANVKPAAKISCANVDDTTCREAVKFVGNQAPELMSYDAIVVTPLVPDERRGGDLWLFVVGANRGNTTRTTLMARRAMSSNAWTLTAWSGDLPDHLIDVLVRLGLPTR